MKALKRALFLCLIIFMACESSGTFLANAQTKKQPLKASAKASSPVYNPSIKYKRGKSALTLSQFYKLGGYYPFPAPIEKSGASFLGKVVELKPPMTLEFVANLTDYQVPSDVLTPVEDKGLALTNHLETTTKINLNGDVTLKDFFKAKGGFKRDAIGVTVNYGGLHTEFFQSFKLMNFFSDSQNLKLVEGKPFYDNGYYITELIYADELVLASGSTITANTELSVPVAKQFLSNLKITGDIERVSNNTITLKKPVYLAFRPHYFKFYPAAYAAAPIADNNETSGKPLSSTNNSN